MPTLPTTYGRADWTDYADYWRELDAEWLMKRSILRYDSEAVRNAAPTGYPVPEPGMVSYLFPSNRLDLYTGGKWVPVIAAQNLTVAPVTGADADPVVIGHKGAAGGGISFGPDSVNSGRISATRPFQMGGGTVLADTTGLTLKTGAATAKLTTDATYLVSSIPLNVAGTSQFVNVNITGTTVINDATITINTLTVTNLMTISKISLGQMASESGDRAARKDYVDAQVATRMTQAAGDARWASLGFNTFNNYQQIVPGQDTCLRLCATTPLLEWRNAAVSVRYAHINATAAAMNIVSDAGDITLNSGGGQVRTSDAIYCNGTSRFWPTYISIIGSSGNAYTQFFGNGSSVDSTGVRTGYVGSVSNHLHLRNEVNGGHIYLTADSYMLLATGVPAAVSTASLGSYERMRIDPSGNVLIGKTAVNAYAEGIDLLGPSGQIYSSISSAGIRNINCHHNGAADANGSHFFRFSRHSTGVGIASISQNGTSGVLYNTTCDYRTKTIIGPIVNATERLLALKPYRVIWNDDPERGETDDFMAHEVAEVVPDAVVGEKDAVDEDGKPIHQQMGESRLMALVVAGLQDTIERVKAIENKLSPVRAAA